MIFLLQIRIPLSLSTLTAHHIYVDNYRSCFCYFCVMILCLYTCECNLCGLYPPHDFYIYLNAYWQSVSLNIYNLTSPCIFSILFSIHFLRCWQGEFVYQSRECLVGDHFFFLMTLLCDGVILLGEIRC